MPVWREQNFLLLFHDLRLEICADIARNPVGGFLVLGKATFDGRCWGEEASKPGHSPVGLFIECLRLSTSAVPLLKGVGTDTGQTYDDEFENEPLGYRGI